MSETQNYSLTLFRQLDQELVETPFLISREALQMALRNAIDLKLPTADPFTRLWRELIQVNLGDTRTNITDVLEMIYPEDSALDWIPQRGSELDEAMKKQVKENFFGLRATNEKKLNKEQIKSDLTQGLEGVQNKQDLVKVLKRIVEKFGIFIRPLYTINILSKPDLEKQFDLENEKVKLTINIEANGNSYLELETEEGGWDETEIIREVDKALIKG